jgi:hypothetical protein
VAVSHLKTQDVCVCRKNFLEEHGLSLGRFQAVTVGEKLATLEWVFEGVIRIQVSSMIDLSTHGLGTGLRAGEKKKVI